MRGIIILLLGLCLVGCENNRHDDVLNYGRDRIYVYEPEGDLCFLYDMSYDSAIANVPCEHLKKRGIYNRDIRILHVDVGK